MNALAGMMFQNPDLQFCMDTVNGELALCLENMGEDPAEMDGKIQEALSFCGIGHLRDRAFHTLSGGESEGHARVYGADSSQVAAARRAVRQYRSGTRRRCSWKSSAAAPGTGMGIVAVDHQLAPWLPIGDEAVLLEGARAAAGASLPGIFTGIRGNV